MSWSNRAESAPSGTGPLRACLAAAALFLAAVAAQPSLGAERVVPQQRDEVMLSFAPVVRQAAPAVVNIFTKRKVKQRRPVTSLLDDPFFQRFFGGNSDGQRRRNSEQSSLGSGVIVDPDGFVVTNEHVIKGASIIKVVLNDRREFEAELVLADPRTDLAVLRINPEGEALPSIAFRDSDTVEVGDLVLALGNPFGVGQTVTSGIVSALARTQVGITDFSFFIQTDAAINPGNSGGALVTMDGRLIGINTAIYSRTGGSVGIGFAIPANMVRTVVASARSGGALVRAWSGLSGQTLTSELAEGLRLERPGGVVINEVYEGGPADRAGVKAGDVLVTIDEQPVNDLEALNYRVATGEIGRAVNVGLYRQGALISAVLPLEPPPETPLRNEIRLLGHHPLGGAIVASLSPALAEEMELSGHWQGVIITRVQRGTPARRVGFRANDIILSLNGTVYKSSAELATALDRSADRWEVTFKRGGKVRKVAFGP
ncbi:Do family serine endopeptidase [Pelagibius litoralis]|uniref:Do family serine endopeptidase n=1 Tax=Pelagibius litoralis TaxID=374515 RepID=UPI001F0ED14E|nr:Do family serine endopeptidase [Pelagibius litoralis]